MAISLPRDCAPWGVGGSEKNSLFLPRKRCLFFDGRGHIGCLASLGFSVDPKAREWGRLWLFRHFLELAALMLFAQFMSELSSRFHSDKVLTH